MDPLKYRIVAAGGTYGETATWDVALSDPPGGGSVIPFPYPVEVTVTLD
jgi:hypothetical protein